LGEARSRTSSVTVLRLLEWEFLQAGDGFSIMTRFSWYYFFSLLCISMIFHSLTQYIDQDEEQYVTAAYLAQNLTLYNDFIYLQTPIYPLILSWIFLLTGGVGKFLVARLLSGGLAIGTVAIFFSVAARLAESKRAALILTALFASSPVMLLAYGSTRNDIMPIFFGLCAVWSVLSAYDWEKDKTRHCVRLFAGGICMMFAVSAKITAVFIPLTISLYMLIKRNQDQGLKKATAKLSPLILGGALGSVPILYFALTAFDSFFYANVTFHLTAPIQYYTDVGREEILTWAYRVCHIGLEWLGEPMLLVAALFLSFAVFIAWQRGSLSRLTAELSSTNRGLVIILMLAAIPVVFLPRPSWRQYLQPMVPYVLLSCAVVYPLSKRILHRRQFALFVLMASVILTLQVSRFAIQGVRTMSAPLWTVTQVHELSTSIVGYLNQSKLSGPVATAYPLLIFDAGGDIYPEFATGIYFFRSGDHLPSERVLQLNGVSPETLPILLSGKPPAAVFIGNTEVDRPLLHWAVRNCYVEVPQALSGWRGGPYIDEIWQPRLFVRPNSPRPLVLCDDHTD
jgi:hypothetical protein